jgi:uncharacterized protein YukE
MSSFFQVDLETLAQTVSQLQQADDVMQDALKLLSSGGDGESIGTKDLDSAADDFQKTWHYGMTQLHSIIQDTTKGVKQAHQNYQEAEQQIGSMLQKFNGPLQQLGQAVGGIK